MNTWLIYALLSAIFASLVAIFAKMGLSEIDSNAATVIRAVIMAIFLLIVVFLQSKTAILGEIMMNKKALTFIVLSGLAGALSWLFYFLAIQNGPVSKVAPIDKLSVVFSVILALVLFGERLSFMASIGVILITAGALIIAFAK